MDEQMNKLKSETVVEEWSGTSSNKLSLTAVISPSSSPSHFTVKTHGNRFNLFSRRFLEAFVPEGFPSSVTPDYIPFQTWDLLQGLSTYIRMMLSTQALLSAIGVGEKSATVIGATFQWFLRDLTGMLGGVMFTFYQGSNLDSNAKMWRLVADLMNDLAVYKSLTIVWAYWLAHSAEKFKLNVVAGMLMDLLSPLFPSAFVFIVCIGSLSRSFTGVASGATRAALTQHFALQNNAADISAKEGSQETVATMIGMALGMFLARITMGHATIIWFSFLSLTMFHMYVLSPKEVSVLEHVLPLWISSWGSKNSKFLDTRIRLGVRVSSLNSLEMMELLSSAGSRYEKAPILRLENGTPFVIINHLEGKLELRGSREKDKLEDFTYTNKFELLSTLDSENGKKIDEFRFLDTILMIRLDGEIKTLPFLQQFCSLGSFFFSWPVNVVKAHVYSPTQPPPFFYLLEISICFIDLIKRKSPNCLITITGQAYCCCCTYELHLRVVPNMPEVLDFESGVPLCPAALSEEAGTGIVITVIGRPVVKSSLLNSWSKIIKRKIQRKLPHQRILQIHRSIPKQIDEPVIAVAAIPVTGNILEKGRTSATLLGVVLDYAKSGGRGCGRRGEAVGGRDEDAEEVRSAGPGRGGLGSAAMAAGRRGGGERGFMAFSTWKMNKKLQIQGLAHIL
ncbi:hypothetical protein CTI12_AA587730 [Artemisia annua]|uniref:Protein root UVB sensitive/RUS domain-containing protein n=1 Tax=Artemisia annua TaxID=35608 RepID=A0A2U1KLZ3_ARTAN|nr:hypothetical protein CTI12_AA587730 [Artemisia annua]